MLSTIGMKWHRLLESIQLVIFTMHLPPASNANYGMVALWLFNLLSGKWVGSAMSHLTATNGILLLGEFIWRHIDWTTVTRMQSASFNMQRRNKRTIDQSFPCVCASIFLVCFVSSPAPRRIKWINTPTCMSKLFVHLFKIKCIHFLTATQVFVQWKYGSYVTNVFIWKP